ncbi:MAG TPA: hypothetical protein VGI39_00610 [Polyangiaceae bacterium]|jgi:hypothetical protein
MLPSLFLVSALVYGKPVVSRASKASRLRLFALFGLVVANAAACQGVLGLSDSTEIVDAGVPPGGDGSPLDASDEEAMDGGLPVDATLESSLPDAQGPEGSAPDATGLPDADAGMETGADGGDADAEVPPDGGFVEPAVGCAQQTPNLFCADFDTNPDVTAGWGWHSTSLDGGLILRDTNDFHSGPASVQFSCPPEYGYVQLGWQRDALTSRVRVAFDVRIDMATLAGIAQVGLVQMGIGDPNSFDFVLETDGGATVEEYLADGGYKRAPVQTPPLETWTRIAFEYSASGGLAVYEDGKMLMSDSTVLGLQIYAPMLIVGGAFMNFSGSAPLVAEFDNVVMRGE